MLNISGLKLPFIGGMLVAGDVYFVDSGSTRTNNGNQGLHPAKSPLATLEGAYDKCTTNNGDFVIVLPGHSETITTSLTWAKSGITVVGIGTAGLRPTILGTAAIDDIDVTGNNNRFSNLVFQHTTANSTAMINLAGTGNKVDNCRFEQSQYSQYAVVIAYTADDSVVEDCEFCVSANGPLVGVSIEKSTTAGPARPRISRNDFNGTNATNAWDTGGIFSDGVFTNARIDFNTFQYMKASIGGIQLTTTSTGVMIGNWVSGTSLGQLIDPGALSCFNNYEHDEEAAHSSKLFPATTVS